ncbi:cupin domain-containing protein [Pelistega ratti]|uniref:cupin domain-containing protein n=2 Tax=Pelistega ratti TaxID=2652177 RepID=UPI0013589F22|nr:cupin domain-containing protein [Pelistega ratti]
MLINIPVSVKQFREEYFEQKPFLIKNAVKKENLLSWKHINEILPRCNLISESKIKLMYQGNKLAKEAYLEQYDDLGTIRYKFHQESLYNFMRAGATLVANGIVNEPHLDIFCQEISSFLGCHTFASLYIAFNSERSFKNHWDSRDIFAIQMKGRKRWLIYKPTFPNPLYMHKSKEMPLYQCDTSEVYMDIMLEEGDVLYLPRGWWHDPIPVGEETVHLAIGIFPPYANNYLNWITKKVVDNEVARKSLHSFAQDEVLLEELAKVTSDSIKDRANYMRFLEEFYDSKRIESPLNLEIFANHKNTSLSEDTKIGFISKNHWHDKYQKIIANGYGIAIDEKFKPILEHLQQPSSIALPDLLNSIENEEDKQSILDLLWSLSYLGILKIQS